MLIPLNFESSGVGLGWRKTFGAMTPEEHLAPAAEQACRIKITQTIPGPFDLEIFGRAWDFCRHGNPRGFNEDFIQAKCYI